MRILNYLEDLKIEYKSRTCFTDNQVCLLGPDKEKPLVAEHTIFPPMSDELIQHLRDSYKRTIPSELIDFYRTANGIDLFLVRRKLSGLDILIPCRQLSVYGIPLTFSRDRLEPYNISIEDLSRLPGTPENWLKFGSFCQITDGNVQGEYDLFVDVDSNGTYLCPRTEEKMWVVRNWDSIDECLCDLFMLLHERHTKTGDGSVS